ncbi:hypothetical protein N7504_001565 [Penicillium tannophilum]|nr:hypothetical protein N7504_001565 [Penicillium tannophilum]
MSTDRQETRKLDTRRSRPSWAYPAVTQALRVLLSKSQSHLRDYLSGQESRQAAVFSFRWSGSWMQRYKSADCKAALRDRGFHSQGLNDAQLEDPAALPIHA